jgi:hypothetical protein
MTDSAKACPDRTNPAQRTGIEKTCLTFMIGTPSLNTGSSVLIYAEQRPGMDELYEMGSDRMPTGSLQI